MYARWLDNLSPTKWITTLTTAKCRVTPVQGLTTPRSELCGLLILVRLVNTCIKSLDVKVKRVTLIGDSSCVISSFDATSVVLNPYFANRIAECADTMKDWGTVSRVKMMLRCS